MNLTETRHAPKKFERVREKKQRVVLIGVDQSRLVLDIVVTGRDHTSSPTSDDDIRDQTLVTARLVTVCHVSRRRPLIWRLHIYQFYKKIRFLYI